MTTQEIERPELTAEMEIMLSKAAQRINAIRDQNYRLFLVVAICYENARLLVEVNQFRAAAGLPLLPVFDPA